MEVEMINDVVLEGIVVRNLKDLFERMTLIARKGRRHDCNVLVVGEGPLGLRVTVFVPE
jgi:hypothetical protein